MKSWLGQQIKPGDIVYRGARDGTTSTFKIGIVEYVKESTARVAWKYRQSWEWITPIDGSTRYFVNYGEEMSSMGSPSLDSLVVVDQSMLDFQKHRIDAIKVAQELGICRADIETFIESFIA